MITSAGQEGQQMGTIEAGGSQGNDGQNQRNNQLALQMKELIEIF